MSLLVKKLQKTSSSMPERCQEQYVQVSNSFVLDRHIPILCSHSQILAFMSYGLSYVKELKNDSTAIKSEPWHCINTTISQIPIFPCRPFYLQERSKNSFDPSLLQQTWSSIHSTSSTSFMIHVRLAQPHKSDTRVL